MPLSILQSNAVTNDFPCALSLSNSFVIFIGHPIGICSCRCLSFSHLSFMSFYFSSIFSLEQMDFLFTQTIPLGTVQLIEP